VGEHLVIDELVGLGGLDHAVQGHDPAHAGVLEDHQVLVFGTHLVQQLVDAETLAVAVVESFQVFAHGAGSRRNGGRRGRWPAEKARILLRGR
jgi:hypothetical protein